MTVTWMEIPDRVGAIRPSLFRKTTREALADLVAQRWPVGRRKSVIRAFGLTDDEARAVINGTASHGTLDKVFDAGGWALALDVYAIRFGHAVDLHLAREKAAHEERAAKLGENIRRLRSVGG